jgi:hypothetical protein
MRADPYVTAELIYLINPENYGYRLIYPSGDFQGDYRMVLS